VPVQAPHIDKPPAGRLFHARIHRPGMRKLCSDSLARTAEGLGSVSRR